MNPSQLDSSRYTRQILSNSTRRDVLWNVSQPGDPYDIKKSMIAKLPGDKKVPMGQHLQLVCLLQAAEIERLCEFLDEYKLKFREIERNNLDRHSYEVQIKELTEKVNGEQSLKIQYSKLRDFSKKLQIENQQLQRGNRSNSQLEEGYKLNYQRTLQRLEAIMKQNTELRQQIEEYRYQIQSFAARQQALQRAKNREIEDLKLNFTQYSRETYQSAISSYRLQSEAEVKRLQYELKRIKQMSDAKNAEISDLQQRLRNATEEIKHFSQEYNSKYQLSTQLRQYENKFVIFGTQIQRLNIALGDCTNKFQESDRKRKQLQNKLYQTQSSIHQYEAALRQKDSQIYKLNDQLRRFDSDSHKIGEVQQLVSQYESQLTKQVRELELTNSKLKYELDNSKRLREEIERLTFENSRYRLLEKQNAGLKESSLQVSNLKRRLVELENKIMLLAQENQRLQFISKSKEAEIEKYRNIALENQTLKSKISQTEYTITSKYEYEFSRIKSQYEQKLQYLSKSQGSQNQLRIQNYEGELQRLKNTLRVNNQDRQSQRSKIYELEASIARSDLQNSAKLKNYQLALNNLKRENQDLYSKLKAASDAQRKVFESQSRLTQYDRQLDRISNNLKQRQQQVLILKGKLRQSELALQRYEFDIGKSKSSYEQTMNSLKIQNQALNKRLSELVSESNKKLIEASQEIERLGSAIRAKNEEKIQLQARLKQSLQELQYMKQALQKMNSENDQLKKRLFESEAKINSLLNDSNSNIRTLSQQNEQLKRQINETKNQINLWEFQINKKTTIFQQNNQTLVRENQDLKHKISDYQARLTLFSQQIQRLGFQLKNKTDEYNAKKLQSEKLIQTLKQYQIQVNNHLQGQVKKKFLQNEQKIKDLLNQNEELRKKIAETTQRFNIELEKANISIRQLAQQNDALKQQLRKFSEEKIRIQTTIKQISNENQGLKKQFKQYEIQINQNYQGQIQKKNRAYQQNITKLNQQNEDLRRKLQELTGEFNRKTSENDTKFISLTQQYEKLRGNANAVVQQNTELKKKLQAYEASIKNYQTEVNRRFATYEQNASLLNKENQELRRRLQDLGDLNRKIVEYESRIAMLGQQLERLNGLLTKASQQNEGLRRQLNEKNQQSSNYELEFSKKIATYESNIGFMQKEYEDFKRKNIQLDQRLRATLSELDNANNNLQKHQLAIRQYEGQLLKSRSTSDQRINSLQTSNQELKRKLLQLGDATRKNQQMQNRLALLSQELERLTNNLRAKHEENIKLEGQLRSQANEVEIWHKKCTDLQLSFNNTYENEIKRRYATYQQAISELNRRNTETQGKLNSSVQEIQRLSNILRLKTDESSQQAANLRSLKNENDELIRRIKDSQNNFSQNSQNLKRENDDLRRKIQEYETFLAQIKTQNERRLIETQSRFKSLSQQNERITSLLKNRTEELEITRKQFKQYEFSVNQKMEGEVKTQLIQYDAAVSTLKKENEELRRRLLQAGDLSRTIAEYQNKIMLLSQEIQRLNSIVTSKGQQNIRLSKQADELRRKLTEFSQINRKIPEYEQKMGLLLQENEKMQNALRNKTDELGALDMKYRQAGQQIENLRKKVTTVQTTWSSKFDMEVNKRITTYEQNLNGLNKERDEWIRRKGDYEAKIALLSQQLERIGGQLKIKSQQSLRLQAEIQNMRKQANQKIQSSESQLTILQSNYSSVTKEYETAKRHLQEYQLSIRKLYTQFERLQGIINELKRENQSLHSMNHNLSTQIQRLTTQNKDLQVQVEQVRLRLSDESALQKRINQHLALMVVLFAEIETLRSRVKDKEKQVAEVRRSSLAPNIL